MFFPPQPGRNDTQKTSSSAETGVKPGVCPVLGSVSVWMQRRETSHVPHTGMGNVEGHLAGRSDAAGCAVVGWERSRFCLNTVNFQSCSLWLSPIPLFCKSPGLQLIAVAVFPSTVPFFSSKGGKTSSVCLITPFHCFGHTMSHPLVMQEMIVTSSLRAGDPHSFRNSACVSQHEAQAVSSWSRSSFSSR